MPLKKGHSLQTGKYVVQMQLSSGGLSAVYLAQMPDKALVVVKEAALPGSVEEGALTKARELFKREAQILQGLRHPRIARVIDYFVESGRDYLVIEFVPGESLRQTVRKFGAQSELTVLTLARQVAQILSFLHSQDSPVVHRDITPDNLMLKDRQDIVLIDFGAANTYVGTATGTLIGKQNYIAPEQFRGKASIQSDYYSLGCTMYYLLTGQDPEALSVSRPREKRPELAEDIDQLVACLTSLDQAKRPATANDLIDMIDMLIPDTMLSLSGADGKK